MDDVLGQAQAVAGGLGEQRRIFDNVGLKLENVAARFPLVSGLLNAIRRKKNKVGLLAGPFMQLACHDHEVAFFNPFDRGSQRCAWAFVNLRLQSR